MIKPSTLYEEISQIGAMQLLEDSKPKQAALLNYPRMMHDRPIEQNRFISHRHIISMDKLRVHLLRAAKSFEGSTAEVCEQIGKQIDSDLAVLDDEQTARLYSDVVL